MDLTSIVIMLCIGNTAGWIAGIYFEGGRFGLLGDVTAATAGAMLAGYLYRLPVPVAGTIGLLICGMTGAVLATMLLRRCTRIA